MNKFPNIMPNDNSAKLVFYKDYISNKWDYDLAFYREGKWLECCNLEDITYVVEYWEDVKVPNE